MTTKQLRTEQLESNAGVERGFSASQHDIKAPWEKAREATDVTFTAWEKASKVAREAWDAYFSQWGTYQGQAQGEKAAWEAYDRACQLDKDAMETYLEAYQLEKDAWETFWTQCEVIQ